MSKLMTLQELVDIENKYGIDDFILYFNDFIDEINRRIKNNDKSIENIFKKEPNWGNLDKKRISWIVSASNHIISKSNKSIKRYKWMIDEKFVLKKPYFACNAKGMLRVILLQESPYWFAMNNIWVSENVLNRV